MTVPAATSNARRAKAGPPTRHQLALMIWVAVFPTLTVLNLALGDWLATLSGAAHVRSRDRGRSGRHLRADAATAQAAGPPVEPGNRQRLNDAGTGVARHPQKPARHVWERLGPSAARAPVPPPRRRSRATPATASASAPPSAPRSDWSST